MKALYTCLIGIMICACSVQNAHAENALIFVTPPNTHGITVSIQNGHFGAIRCRVTIPKNVEGLKEALDAGLVATGDYSCSVPLKVVVEKTGDRIITFSLSKKSLQQSMIYMSSGIVTNVVYAIELKQYTQQDGADQPATAPESVTRGESVSSLAHSPILQNMAAKASDVLVVTCDTVSGGSTKEIGVEERTATCRVDTAIKGKLTEGKKILIHFNRFTFGKGKIPEPLRFAKDVRYVVFLDGSAGAGTEEPGTDPMPVYRLLDRWLSVQPYNSHLVKQLKPELKEKEANLAPPRYARFEDLRAVFLSNAQQGNKRTQVETHVGHGTLVRFANRLWQPPRVAVSYVANDKPEFHYVVVYEKGVVVEQAAYTVNPDGTVSVKIP